MIFSSAWNSFVLVITFVADHIFSIHASAFSPHFIWVANDRNMQIFAQLRVVLSILTLNFFEAFDIHHMVQTKNTSTTQEFCVQK